MDLNGSCAETAESRRRLHLRLRLGHVPHRLHRLRPAETGASGMKTAQMENKIALPKRSFYALNAANFFQAEMVGVVMPVLNVVLRRKHWSYDTIGLATAAGGLGTLLLQS